MQDTQFKNQLIDIDLEGKTLPAVTSADEGKVLTVDSSGAWTVGEGGGGGGNVEILIDHITFDADENAVHTLDKTAEQLLTGLANGTMYFLKSDTPITDPPPEVIYHMYGSFMYYQHTEGENYQFFFYGAIDPLVADTLNDYPTYTESWA